MYPRSRLAYYICLFFFIVGCGGTAVLNTAKPAREDKPKGSQLIFQSGFEGSSTVVQDSKKIPGFITQGYPIDDITGIDNQLKTRNNWVSDLDDNPDAGQFLIEYTGGTYEQRFVKIIPEPGNEKNHVLQFWINDSWHASEDQTKARVQTDLYGIKKGFKDFYQSVKVFLPAGFNELRKYPGTFSWLTIAEFWNNEWWVKDEKYGFRVSLGITKPVEGETDLYFGLNAENAGQKKVWDAKDGGGLPAVKVPLGKWFTMDYHYKEGDAGTGKFSMTIQPEGEEKQVVFNITNFTHNTTDPAPDGVTGFSPMKLYTSSNVIAFVRSKGKPLEVYWDDFKLWRDTGE